MDVGHSGASGRFEALKEVAKNMFFVRFREDKRVINYYSVSWPILNHFRPTAISVFK